MLDTYHPRLPRQDYSTIPAPIGTYYTALTTGRRDMTEKLLKNGVKPNTHTHYTARIVEYNCRLGNQGW